MIGRRYDPTCNRRQAFTLLEVLLVLFVLVAIAGLAWPSLQRPFAAQRLRKAADGIRAKWTRARVDAMDSGQTHIFRYTPDGNRFRIEHDRSINPEVNPLTQDSGISSADLSETAAAADYVEGTLPDGVTFLASQTTSDTEATTAASSPETLSTAEPGWSEPIFFYPDGTTATVQLLLKNDQDRVIELSLRGLTGVVSIGPLQSAEGR